MKQEDIDRLINASIKWEGLVGIQNTKENVLRKASVLADEITRFAFKTIKEITQSLSEEIETEIDDNMRWTLYYDLLLYMLHLSDREAFNYLEKDKQKIFMNQLYNEIVKFCCEDFKDEIKSEQFAYNFQHAFELFQKEYGFYKRGQTEYLEDNLEYNFTTRTIERLGCEKDVFLHAIIFPFITSVDILLNLPDLLDDTKKY